MKKIYINKNNYIKKFLFFIINFQTIFISFADENQDQDQISLVNLETIGELEFEKTLKISRPSSCISVESDTYFITGTCNPNEILYLNDSVVKNTETGVFGVEVKLNLEKNIFNFKQDNNQKSITIFKNSSNVSPNQCNKSICPSKTKPAFPVMNKIVTDKKLKLSCPAFLESKVTAQIDEKEFELSPENKNNEKQEYCQFVGEADFSDFKDQKYDSEYYNAGPVKYIINNNNNKTEIISDGAIIFSNTDDPSTKFVEVSKTRASIFESPNLNSKTLTTIKRGCVLETTQEEENEEWFKLKDFGWIAKSSVCPADPDSEIENQVLDSNFFVEESREKLVLCGSSKPNFATNFSKVSSKLTVRLYHTKDLEISPDLYKESNLIESISLDQQPCHVDVIFNLKPDINISGYNIEYDDNNTEIIIIKSKIQDDLKNINIILDAGHGGFDSGAKGLLGQIGGPVEKDFNLIYAKTLKEKLENKGAKVSLIRDGDYNISLNNIAKKIEEEKPDFFISIHSDSIDENISPNKVSGFTIFYDQKELSGDFADKIENNLSSKNYLKSRGTKKEDFYIIKNTACPSVLIETGLITNPIDVSYLVTQKYLNHFADSIVSALNK
ncbi:MAG: N-acetylmuramoyl-L-alanine amidase [Oscillospiraceae bacterium]|nr:N-acetylmuramoyl-L-alanine amidase [Oscillospiraceae bacterium]